MVKAVELCGNIKFGSMRLTHKKTVFSHKLCTFFEAVNYKQSTFHIDLVN